MRFDSLGEHFWLLPLQRIYFLYMGSVIILIGLLIYWVFCPFQSKQIPHDEAILSLFKVTGITTK